MRKSGLIILLFALVLAGPALAQSADEALGRLAAPGFDEIEKGIRDLAASGDPRAEPVLSALSDGRLLARPDHHLLVKDRDGTLRDAATGAPRRRQRGEAGQGEQPPAPRARRRRRHADAAKPRSGKASGRRPVGVRPAGPGDAPRGRAAVRRREGPVGAGGAATGARGHPARQGSHARGAAGRSGDARRLAVPEALNKLQAALLGLPADADPQLKAALQGAIASIQQRLQLLGLALNLFQGISLGSVLLLAAIGLAITFGVMGVINMAHGEMVMLGAYTVYVVQEVCRAWWPGGLEVSLLIALPLAFLVTGAVGVAIERTIISRLYGRPLETLLATWGLSLMLQQAVRTLFGASNREVSAPAWMSDSSSWHRAST